MEEKEKTEENEDAYAREYLAKEADLQKIFDSILAVKDKTTRSASLRLIYTNVPESGRKSSCGARQWRPGSGAAVPRPRGANVVVQDHQAQSQRSIIAARC